MKSPNSVPVGRIAQMPRVAALAACCILALACGAAAAEPTELKFASFTAPTSETNTIAIPKFIEAVEKASEGTLRIKLYAGGTLGRSPAIQLKLVESGVADIAQVVASYTPGRFPELAVFELPFLARSNTEGSVAAWRLYKKGLFSGFDDFHIVGFLESGPYGLHTIFPVEKLEDLKGKKLRAAGPIHGALVRALGAVPVGNVTAPAIAESISRGVLDGTLMSWASLRNFRIIDTAFHHMTDLPMGSVSIFFAMNKQKYESLAPKAKAALDKHAGEWFSRVVGDVQDRDDQDVLKSVAGNGKHTIHHLDPAARQQWEKALGTVVGDWNKPNAKGVNLYQEVQKTLAEIRAGK